MAERSTASAMYLEFNQGVRIFVSSVTGAGGPHGARLAENLLVRAGRAGGEAIC